MIFLGLFERGWTELCLRSLPRARPSGCHSVRLPLGLDLPDPISPSISIEGRCGCWDSQSTWGALGRGPRLGREQSSPGYPELEDIAWGDANAAEADRREASALLTELVEGDHPQHRPVYGGMTIEELRQRVGRRASAAES